MQLQNELRDYKKGSSVRNLNNSTLLIFKFQLYEGKGLILKQTLSLLVLWTSSGFGLFPADYQAQSSKKI